MFCPNCGKEITGGNRFCGNCGHQISSGKPKSSAALNSKRLLIVAVAVIVVLLAVLAILLFRTGEDGENDRRGQDTDESVEEENAKTDLEDAIVGTWTNSDGVGLTFTAGGTLRLSGFGLSLGGDTFKYEVQDENTIYITADNALGLGFDATYGIVGDTLFIQLAEYSFELTKK